MKMNKAVTLATIVLILLSMLAINGYPSLKFALADDPTPPIVYVARDGSGDFNCDGVSDQVEINEAIDFVASHKGYTTVYLKAGTYVIDEPIIMQSNVILTGDKTAKIRLKDYVRWWTKDKPMITQKGTEWDPWGNKNDSIRNVEIYGFEIDGGTQAEPTGQEYIPLIHFKNPYNISIHDMYLRNSRYDIIRITASSYNTSIKARIYNNRIEYSGHEGICFVAVTDFKAYNNSIYSTRTNSGIRATDCNNFSIYGNVIGNDLTKRPSGYAGILLENKHVPIDNAEIYNNFIYGKVGGIILSGENGGYDIKTRHGVHIHHNIIYKIRMPISPEIPLYGGICIDGFNDTIIEYNVIESCETDGIVYMRDSGEGKAITVVKNNIISNNRRYGVNNLNPGKNSFISEYNDVFNNWNGNYNNVFSSTDIHTDPLYAHASFKAGWHHVVVTYDSHTGVFKIYIDGEKKMRKQYPFGKIARNNEYTYLGTYRGKAYWLYGKLDDVAVWERALSDDEVAFLWNDGKGNIINGSLLKGLKAYWQMENNWNDSCGNYNGYGEYCTANFTTDAKIGNYAAVFEHTYAVFPDDLSPSSAITISAWIYRDESSMKNDDIQTIFNKGSEDANNHIWLYCKGDNFYFEIGNGETRIEVSSPGLTPDEADFHLKSEYGRWNSSGWTQDNVTSPCINSGEPGADYSNEPLPNGERVNIGAYGNTPQASKGYDTPVADAGGPYIGVINEAMQFTGYVYSGHPPYTYSWNFGDGATSNRRNPVHEYAVAGNYTVTLTVRDGNGKVAQDITWALILKENSPPSKPQIEGKEKGNYGVEYGYTFYSTDPENQSIWYYIEWGDGTNSGWIGPYKSGEKVTRWHTWDKPGSYTLRVKAKDAYGMESEWATLKIIMPRNMWLCSLSRRILNVLLNLFPVFENMLEMLMKMLSQWA